MLRGPLLHKVSPIKREPPFWRPPISGEGLLLRRASCSERTSCKYRILQAAITKVKLFRDKT